MVGDRRLLIITVLHGVGRAHCLVDPPTTLVARTVKFMVLKLSIYSPS